MHTHTTKNDTLFHFNSDGSGDVIISKLEGDATKFDETRMSIPFEDLLAFVANFVRYEKIGELEDMDDKELLGIVR